MAEVIIMPKVACTVSNCTYWAASNVCSADEILIEVDKHAKQTTFNEEFANEHFSNHHDRAEKASATCCLTFKENK